MSHEGIVGEWTRARFPLARFGVAAALSVSTQAQAATSDADVVAPVADLTQVAGPPALAQRQFMTPAAHGRTATHIASIWVGTSLLGLGTNLVGYAALSMLFAGYDRPVGVALGVGGVAIGSGVTLFVLGARSRRLLRQKLLLGSPKYGYLNQTTITGLTSARRTITMGILVTTGGGVAAGLTAFALANGQRTGALLAIPAAGGLTLGVTLIVKSAKRRRDLMSDVGSTAPLARNRHPTFAPLPGGASFGWGGRF